MRMYICMLFNIKIRTLKKVEKQKSRMAIMRADKYRILLLPSYLRLF